MLFNENPNRKLSRILLPKWHICLRLHQTLYEMSMKFVPGSAAQARRTQQAFLEIERDEKVEPQAPTNDRRRKRARYDSTDEEDGVSTHHATEVAKRITNREPYEADNKRGMNRQVSTIPSSVCGRPFIRARQRGCDFQSPAPGSSYPTAQKRN